MNTIISDTHLTDAMHLADEAAKITKMYFRGANLETVTKADSSPVTKADLEVEAHLSRIIEDELHEAVVGEEGARSKRTSSAYWVLDPIDGTRNFLRGLPVWATLIARVDEHGTQTAVVDAPMLGRRWWAVRGQGSYTVDVDSTIRRISVSEVNHLDESFLLYGSLFSWDKVPVGSSTVLKTLKAAWRHRSFGDFLNYMLLAEGAAEGCFEPDLKLWDIVAPALIVREAGGAIWHEDATEVPPEKPRIVVASNGLVHGALLDSLGLSK